MSNARQFRASLAPRAALAALMLTLSSQPSHAVMILTRDVLMEGGKVDFGAGLHTNGTPEDAGTLKWDFTPSSTGALVATAFLSGRLYNDSILNATVRLRLSFLSSVPGEAPLSTVDRTLTDETADLLTGARDPSNQKRVSVSFVHSRLHRVMFQLYDVRGGTESLVKQSLSASPDFKRVSGVQLGNGITSISGAEITFTRKDGDMLGRVRGVLALNSQAAARPRLVIEYRDISDAVLERVVRDQLCPGGAASLPANQLAFDVASTTSIVKGRLWKIRLLVGMAANSGLAQDVVDPREITFDFLGKGR